MLYSDFTAFTKDQERLISMTNDIGVDYLEGLLMLSNGVVDASFFPPSDQSKIGDLVKKHGIIYILEAAKYYDDPTLPIIGQVLHILHIHIYTLNYTFLHIYIIMITMALCYMYHHRLDHTIRKLNDHVFFTIRLEVGYAYVDVQLLELVHHLDNITHYHCTIYTHSSSNIDSLIIKTTQILYIF